MNKIIGVGMHRTGTGSLRRAFNILGFRCLEEKGCWFMSRMDNRGNLVFDASSDLDLYKAYADNPVPLFFRELDEIFPGSKFILTHREIDAWADSVEHIFTAWWEPWTKLPHWPLINACHKAFYGTERFDRNRAKQAYIRHIAEVRSYFRSRPEALLELDITYDMEWTSLCRFLRTSIPTVPFPRLNTRR